MLKNQGVIRWTWQRILTPKVFICVNCWLLTSTKRLNTSLQMILSIITDRGWVFVDYIYIGRANLLQLIFIISFSLHAKALLVKTVRAVLLNMYWTPITVTVNLVFSELTANEEVFWKFIFFPDAKAKLKRCSWKYLICYLKPEKEIISCMEATRALDSPYLNLFTRWLRSVVLKSLKAVKQKFPFKKNCGEILR